MQLTGPIEIAADCDHCTGVKGVLYEASRGYVDPSGVTHAFAGGARMAHRMMANRMPREDGRIVLTPMLNEAGRSPAAPAPGMAMSQRHGVTADSGCGNIPSGQSAIRTQTSSRPEACIQTPRP